MFRVLIFNLQEWNKLDLDEQLIDFVVKYQPNLPDRDALNVICADKRVSIGSKYQSSPCFEKLQDEVLIHYAGGKPWTPWHFH